MSLETGIQDASLVMFIVLTSLVVILSYWARSWGEERIRDQARVEAGNLQTR